MFFVLPSQGHINTHHRWDELLHLLPSSPQYEPSDNICDQTGHKNNKNKFAAYSLKIVVLAQFIQKWNLRLMSRKKIKIEEEEEKDN